jgi:hypothetical protein
MKDRKYNITAVQWNKNAKFIQKANCNSITFINKSLNNYPTVNGYPLSAGEALSFGGNENEIDDTNYSIGIDLTVGTPNLWIITKNFI